MFSFWSLRSRREFERLVVPDLCAVIFDGRLVGVRRVLRAPKTAQAEIAQQSALHHHQTEPVRDRAHEGLSRAGETDAVVHEIIHGVCGGDGTTTAARYVTEAVQQDGRLRDGYHQTQQSQSGQRAHHADQPSRLGPREVFLTLRNVRRRSVHNATHLLQLPVP